MAARKREPLPYAHSCALGSAHSADRVIAVCARVTIVRARVPLFASFAHPRTRAMFVSLVPVAR
eukprot:3015438-Prymnesium_polylepis.1